MSALTDLSATVVPTVSINSIDLIPTVAPKLKRTVVDTRLHLPDMFELTFEDTNNSVIEQTMVRSAASSRSTAVVGNTEGRMPDQGRGHLDRGRVPAA